jgi:hypothetical protein
MGLDVEPAARARGGNGPVKVFGKTLGRAAENDRG